MNEKQRKKDSLKTQNTKKDAITMNMMLLMKMILLFWINIHILSSFLAFKFNE